MSILFPILDTRLAYSLPLFEVPTHCLAPNFLLRLFFSWAEKTMQTQADEVQGGTLVFIHTPLILSQPYLHPWALPKYSGSANFYRVLKNKFAANFESNHFPRSRWPLIWVRYNLCLTQFSKLLLFILPLEISFQGISFSSTLPVPLLLPSSTGVFKVPGLVYIMFKSANWIF